MRHFRRQGQVKVPVSERWRQVFRDGQVVLRGFTAAELAAVSLQGDAMPPEPGPVLRAVAPAPADLSAPVPAAESIATLEREGYVRPWPPAEPGGPRPIPEEFPGWAEGKAVTLAGDLAIITSTRSRPAWVAEVSLAADPTWPDPEDASWGLLARVYARYTPPAGLLERPAGPDGAAPPYVLLRDDHVLVALVEWCGADIAPAPGEPPAEGNGAEATDTASLAAGFRRLVQVKVALPQGEEVRLRNLIVASGEGGQWLLEGRYWERAVATSANDLGQRLSSLVKSAVTS